MELLGKAMESAFWQEVRQKNCYKNLRDEILKLWENESTKPLLTLNYSDFKRFWVSGDRSIYQDFYFSRRNLMASAAMLSLIYPEEEKYIDKLMDIIFAICDEYTWCLPAHQGELDPVNSVKIDLFAAETGFYLAEIYTLLGERLEPLIRNRITAEIDRRIIVPFSEVESYGWWETGKNNWVAVCTGSVACTFMLMRPQLAEKLRSRFDAAMERYIAGFLDDGVCTEGVGYWNYGFGFFVMYADMIRTFTEGETDYFKRDKIKTIAAFPQKTFLSGQSCISFSDGNPTGTYSLAIHHYLYHEYPDTIKPLDPSFAVSNKFCLYLRAALWYNEAYLKAAFEHNDPDTYYAPDSEWFVHKTNSYGFAAKGGHNEEMHNQNDVGSFIFAKNGRQILTDIGAGLYTRQYFSNERYTIFECRSISHSVPIVDGQEQFTGHDAAAVGTTYENGRFSTDIAGAYKCPGLESILRSFSFTEDSVTMEDNFTYSGCGAIIERLVSTEEPKLLRPGHIAVGDSVISYDPEECNCTFSVETTTKDAQCFLIDFTLRSGVRRFSFTIR